MSLKIGNLSNVTPKTEALIKTFYKAMEDDSAYDEKYEEAAKWRDAHLCEYIVIELDDISGQFVVKESGPPSKESIMK
jgi:hypothetical protein